VRRRVKTALSSQKTGVRSQNSTNATTSNVAALACMGFKTKTTTKRIFAANLRSQLQDPRQAGETLLRSKAMEGEGGQRWAGEWGDVGKVGRMVGKWIGLAHMETASTRLGPDNSTQVVDFPHLAMVSVFSGGGKNSRISGRGMIGSGMAKRSLEPVWEMECWSIGVMEGQSGKKRRARNYARNLPAFIASFHVLSDIIEQIRPVITHFLAYYRSELFLTRQAGNDSFIRNP
jgi:hypothetical protein